MEDIPKTLGVTPTVGDIHINPFLLRLEVKDFSLSRPERREIARLSAGCSSISSCSSIWHRAYSFANIDIDAPFVNAVVAQDGSLNLMQLSPKTAAGKDAGEKGAAAGDSDRFIQSQQGTGDVR